MYLTTDYRDLIEIFNEHEVHYLIVGAYAMSKLGYSRNTYDIDIWIERNCENAKKVIAALSEFGIPFAVEEQDILMPENVIQIGVVPNRIDILTDIDGVDFESAWVRKTVDSLDDLQTNILSIDDLIKNKQATNREKDKIDLLQLSEIKKKQNRIKLGSEDEVAIPHNLKP